MSEDTNYLPATGSDDASQPTGIQSAGSGSVEFLSTRVVPHTMIHNVAGGSLSTYLEMV